MTHDEIVMAWKRLREIAVMVKDSTSTDCRPTMEKTLKELAFEVGVWRPNHHELTNPRVMELVRDIYQALQTASMIDACRIAAQNAELTREALCETRKAQQTSQKVGKAAMVSAGAAIGSMVAAWLAVGINLVTQ